MGLKNDLAAALAADAAVAAAYATTRHARIAAVTAAVDETGRPLRLDRAQIDHEMRGWWARSARRRLDTRTTWPVVRRAGRGVKP